MKSAKIFAGILLFLSFSFTNCSSDHDYLYTTNEIITRGEWGVEFFADPDKTAQYSNYAFQFNGNGVVQSTDGSSTVQGNWNVIRDVDGSDVLTITMKDIQDISSSWNVKQKSTTALQLKGRGNTTEFRIRKL